MQLYLLVCGTIICMDQIKEKIIMVSAMALWFLTQEIKFYCHDSCLLQSEMT